jgi:hypothetical protein
MINDRYGHMRKRKATVKYVQGFRGNKEIVSPKVDVMSENIQLISINMRH